MRILFFLSCIILSSSNWAMAQSDASAVRRILDRYTETLGGQRAVEALSSLSIEGHQIQGETRFDFLLRKKRPDSIRYRLSAGETSVICGYNGRLGWQRTELAGAVTVEDLASRELVAIRAEADFDSPLFRHLEKPWNEISLLEYDQFNDASVTVLEVEKFNKPFARYYLNSRSGLIVKRVQMHADGSLGLETLYRDYREVAGYRFAFEVENRLGDRQVSLVQIHSIEVNPGLLSFYFEKPAN